MSSILSHYPHLAARIFNVALLVHPQKLDAIIAGLGQRLLGSQFEQDLSATAALPTELFSTRKGPRADRGYQVIDGVAVLNVSGALVHKTRMEADSSTLLGYNSIAADLQDAMDNPDVHALLQVWDSPGGEAQGAFEYASRALDLRGKKPFVAIADGMAASAGYLGASAADQIAITSTGYVGSIGVVMRHIDMSAALMAEGVRVSHIYAGSHKIDGNSFEPLSPAVRADFQSEVDSLYTTFIDSVSQARKVNPDALRATQAQTYRGQAAISAGLADRISTTDALISELAAQRARTYPVGQSKARANASTTERTQMQGNQPDGQSSVNPQPQANASPATAPAAAAQPEKPTMTTFTQSDLDAASATAMNAGAQAERVRIATILDHPNASAQAALARQCISTGMSVEQSTAILGAVVAAPAAPAAQGNQFAAAMSAVGNPNVSGIEGKQSSGDPALEAEQLAASVLQTIGARAKA